MLPLPVAAAALLSGVLLWFEHEPLRVVIGGAVAVGLLTVWFKRAVWREISRRKGPAIRGAAAFFVIYSVQATVLALATYWLASWLHPISN
jgi:hypothetical protein